MKKTLQGAVVFALLIIINLFPATVSAQGTAFTYQGRLNDGANLANGSYDLRFALYDAASGGIQQGVMLTNSATPASNGLFTVTLDFGNQFPGANRWLELAVRTNGGSAFNALMPRQLLAATPYAVTAGNLAGPLSSTGLGGTYSGAVALTNAANNFNGAFNGSGAGLTNVNVANIQTGSAVVLLTNAFASQFSFGIASSPVSGSHPETVVAADLNNDGKPDLITANNVDRTYVVLTNNGSGVFVPSCVLSDALYQSGSYPQHIAVGDFNGDGKPDFVGANDATNYVSVFTNAGAGIFGLSSRPATSRFPTGIASADLNHDGSPDLIVAVINTNGFDVLTNDGFGNFSMVLPNVNTPFLGNYATIVAIADFNGDTIPDFACTVGAGSVTYIYLGLGNGKFIFSGGPYIGTPFGPLVTFDANGDGKPDLLTPYLSVGLLVSTNDGAAAFSSNSVVNVGSSVQGVTPADLNGDGKLDLICGGNGFITVMTNNGSGLFGQAATIALSGKSFFSLASADLNGDGSKDFVGADVNGVTLVAVGNNFSTMTTNVTATFQGTFSGSTLIVAGTLTAGNFSGNGSALTGVNAATLGGSVTAGTVTGEIARAQAAEALTWRVDGNNVGASDFIGSTNNQPLEFKVNGDRELRLEYNANTPSIISGYSGNVVSNGFFGATIVGGGRPANPNRVGANNATILGGYGNTASGTGSAVIGESSLASGTNALAIGFIAVASGDTSVAIGSPSVASGISAIALGGGTASGSSAIAAGYGSLASGYYSFAGGVSCTATGFAATAFGYINKAYGDRSTALGVNSTAAGFAATAMGSATLASGDYSTSMGSSTTASGLVSTAIGVSTTASGYGSLAAGGSTLAGGDWSVALGYHAAANNAGSFIFADSASISPFNTTSNNQFLIRASSGVGINTNNPKSALHVNGTIIATTFSGGGAGLTGLNASQITTGTVPDTALSANVALLNGNQTFSNTNTFAKPVVSTLDGGTTTNTSIGQRWRDNTIVAWARVNATGTSTEKFGVTSVTNNSQGVYTITLNDAHVSGNTLIPVASPELDAAPTSAGTIRIASVNQFSTTQFQVFINNGNWSPTNNDFVFIVTGR